MIRTLLTALAFTLFSSSVAATDLDIEHYTLPEHLSRNLPFSDAVRVGKMVYLSGQLGIIPGENTLVPGGIGPESEQTLRNVGRILERFGIGFESLVQCQVMLVDIAEWPAFNSVYRRFISAPFPARSAFAGTGLALNARVELACTAVIPADRVNRCSLRGDYCGLTPCCEGLSCLPAGGSWSGTMRCMPQ